MSSNDIGGTSFVFEDEVASTVADRAIDGFSFADDAVVGNRKADAMNAGEATMNRIVKTDRWQEDSDIIKKKR